MMCNSKKNVSNIYKTSLQRLSVTSPHKSIITILVPRQLFDFLKTRLFHNVKEKFDLVLLEKVEAEIVFL